MKNTKKNMKKNTKKKNMKKNTKKKNMKKNTKKKNMKKKEEEEKSTTGQCAEGHTERLSKTGEQKDILRTKDNSARHGSRT
ncbi:hypothetical protein STEG23_035415, partial [Scotinomys teguina]